MSAAQFGGDAGPVVANKLCALYTGVGPPLFGAVLDRSGWTWT